MSFDLIATATLTCASVIAGAVLIWLENRPRPVGEPRLIPTTPLLFLCALVLILALAHLVSIVTGTPHVGRFGAVDQSNSIAAITVNDAQHPDQDL